MRRQCAEVDDVAAGAGNEEHGRMGSTRADRREFIPRQSGRFALEGCRQLFDGRVLEELRERQAEAEFRLHTAHQANGQQRVAAQFEVVLGNADARVAKNLLPDCGELPLSGSPRRDMGAFSRDSFEASLSQDLAIDLSVASERNSSSTT